MNQAMRNIKIEKLTLNIGAGKDQNVLKKAEILLKHITGIPPVKTITQKRIAAWGLRPGLPIGCKLTLRGKQAKELIPRLLAAKENKLGERNFDDNGNVSFGIKEYIDIPQVRYEPEIGILGLQSCITLSRAGFRIKKRKIQRRNIPHKHRIQKDEAIQFMKNAYNLKIGEEE